MIIAFIPCRLKSSRFPNKGIQPIYGVSSVERCMINAKAIPGVDKVILATSTSVEDDPLEDYTLGGEVEVVRGSEDDVLERFFPAIERYQPEHIIRITGDCPLVSLELGEILINSHQEKNADATFTLSKVALGTALEIYKTSAVEKLRYLFPRTPYSEYLIYYFSNNPKRFDLNIIDAPEIFMKPWRLTLDEETDLKLLNLIYASLDVKKRPVHFHELIDFFKRYPEAPKMNINNVVKYRQDTKLIELLKEATTYHENEVL